MKMWLELAQSDLVVISEHGLAPVEEAERAKDSTYTFPAIEVEFPNAVKTRIQQAGDESSMSMWKITFQCPVHNRKCELLLGENEEGDGNYLYSEADVHVISQ